MWIKKKEQLATEVDHAALPLSSAVRTGLEPATSGVTGRHSNQLNYRTKLGFMIASAIIARGCFPFASAKLLPFFILCKFFHNFFQKKTTQTIIALIHMHLQNMIKSSLFVVGRHTSTSFKKLIGINCYKISII